MLTFYFPPDLEKFLCKESEGCLAHFGKTFKFKLLITCPPSAIKSYTPSSAKMIFRNQSQHKLEPTKEFSNATLHVSSSK